MHSYPTIIDLETMLDKKKVPLSFLGVNVTRDTSQK